VLGALSTALLLVLATVAGFSPLAVAATCSGAVVAVGSAEIAPGVSGGVPITVSQLPSACPSLAGWQISIGYNPAVLSVTGVTGSSQWSSVTANTGTAGTVLLTASQQAGVTGTQVLGTLEFKAVGSAGSSSALTPSAVTLTDPQLEAIGASTSPGSVQIVGGAEAQLAVTPHVSQGGAAGLSATVPAVVYAGSNRTVQGEDVAGYQLNVAASDPTAVRLGAAVCSAAFSGCAARVDQNAGTETVAAAAYQGVAPPTDLAFLPVRLTGPVTEAVQITTTLQNVVDQQGSTLLPPSPVTVTLQRGAVYVACDSGGNPVAGARGLTVADAVAALQYLVRLRQAGAGCGQVNPAALASLVPVGSGQGSQTSVADVVALLQYLVGLRNAQMEMASAGSSGSSTTGTTTTASGGSGGNGGAKPSTAQITAFSVTPSELASSGGTAQLSWTTSNATTCSLTSSPAISGLSQAQVCGSGQITQSLPSNSGTAPAIYTFTLSVSNGNGQTATATATVTVAPASTQTQRASTSLSLNLVNCLEGNAVSASGYTGNGWVAHAGDTVTLGACVSSHGDPLQGIPVVFTVNGHQMEGTTDANGNAYVQLSLSGWPVGTYPITASFTGDSAYQPSSGGNWLTVNPETAAATSLSVTDATGQAGGTATLQATLTANGSPVADQTVTFTVNGQQLPATTDSSGTASATLSLSGVAAGSYTINGSFAGSSAEQASSGTGTLTVAAAQTTATQLGVWGSIPTSGGPAELGAALSDATGNAIAGQTVTFQVNGQQVTATTGSDGLATATIAVTGWPAASYPLIGTFAGGDGYQASTGSSALVVGSPTAGGGTTSGQATALSVSPATGTAGGEATLQATLTAGGIPVSGQTVTFSVAGVKGSGTTNDSGQASATINLTAVAAGSYTIAASYAGGADYAATSANGSLTVDPAPAGQAATALILSGATGEVGGSTTLQAFLEVDDGTQTPLPGQPITFTVNGHTLTGTTDAAGVASVTLSLSGWQPQTYQSEASFAGTSAYEATVDYEDVTVTAAPAQSAATALTVTAVNGTAGTGSVTLQATLLAGTTPVAGAPITFAVDGQTLTGTTNAEGVATATFSLVNVQTGSYTIAASYAGNGTYAASRSSGNLAVAGTTGTAGTSAQVQTLLADLPGLPSGMAQAVQAAAGSLSSTQLQQLLSQVAALSSAQQQHLATVLSTVWPNLSSAQQQALVDTLLGVPTTADQQALAQAASSEWQALQQDLAGLSPTLVNVAEEFSAQYGIAANAQDSSALAQFFDTLLGTLVPHVEALLQTALEREPAVQQVLDLAVLQASLQANPSNAFLMMLSVADSQSEAFIQQAAYEVGLNFLADTSYGFIVDYVSGDSMAPAAIQQDVADCIWSSTCTPAEAQVVVTWIQDSVANEQSQNTLITGLVDQMQAESEASTAGWMAAEAAG
jgi:hypothetical protein